MLPEAFSSLSLARPMLLLLLLPAAGLSYLLYRRSRHFGSWDNLLPPVMRKALLSGKPAQGMAGRHILLALVWFLSIVTLAGPEWESGPAPQQLEQSAIVIVWDMSRDMLANDLAPNRLERARLKIRDLMQLRADSQLALIAFAGSAHPVTPLSTDMATLENLLQALEPGLMPAEGQNIDAALHMASRMIADLPNNSARILLIISGVEPGQQAALERHAAELGPQLSILGVGSAGGSPVPLPEGGFMRDDQGRIVLARLDVQALSALARRNANRYQSIQLNDSDIESLLPLQSRLQQQDSEEQTARQSQAHWLLLLLLPLVALGARRGWLGVLLLCALVLPDQSQAIEWSDLWRTPDQQAMQLLSAEQPAAAARRFKDPLWQAWSHYQAGNYSAAVSIYQTLIALEPDNAELHFNHGTALAMATRYEEALEAYEQTLTRAPEHQAARHNRSRVEAHLKALKEKQKANQDGQDSKTELEDEGNPENPNDSVDNTQTDDAVDQESAAAPQPLSAPPADSGQAQNSGPAAQSSQGQNTDSTSAGTGDRGATVESAIEAGDNLLLQGNNERQAALQLWLEELPDDPAELLRRKFLYQRLQQMDTP